MAAKAVSFEVYGTDKAIEAAILRIHETGQSFQAEVHKTACSILKRISLYGDVRIVQKLLLAMPEGARTNALRDWLVKFGPITFDKNTPMFNKAGTVDFKGACAMPFWKLTPEPEYKAADVDALILALCKRLTTDTAKTGVDHSAVINYMKSRPTAQATAPQ